MVGHNDEEIKTERPGANTYNIASDIKDASTPFSDLTVVGRSPLIDISSDDPLTDQKDIWTDGVSHIKSESKYRLRANSSTESLETVQYLPYSIGYKSEVGIALRVPTAPTGDQEIRWGYWDGNNGAYLGFDSGGVFTEFIRDGTRQGKTYEDDWVSETRNSNVDVETALGEGVVTRLGLSLYNYGEITFEFFPRDDKNRQIRRVVHTGSPRETTTLSQQNNPIRVEVDNPSSSDFDVFVADRQAAVRGNTEASRRITTEFNTTGSLDGTNWVPLVSFRRKSGFNGTEVNVFSLDVQTADDAVLQLRSDVSLTGASWGSPSVVDSSETALEVDLSATDVDATSGYHRWMGGSAGGSGVGETNLTNFDNVDNSLRRERNMTLMVRALEGTTTSDIPYVSLQMEESW